LAAPGATSFESDLLRFGDPSVATQPRPVSSKSQRLTGADPAINLHGFTLRTVDEKGPQEHQLRGRRLEFRAKTQSVGQPTNLCLAFGTALQKFRPRDFSASVRDKDAAGRGISIPVASIFLDSGELS